MWRGRPRPRDVINVSSAGEPRCTRNTSAIRTTSSSVFGAKASDLLRPLYAHPRFVPSPIRSQYTAVTKIPILDARPEGAFGLLLDPHTGVPVADGLSSSASVGHAPLSFIFELNQKLRPEYLICFDQSYHRKHSLSKKGQMEAKLTFLHEKGMHAFYYVSHASFLFIAQKKPVLRTTSETSS